MLCRDTELERFALLPFSPPSFSTHQLASRRDTGLQGFGIPVPNSNSSYVAQVVPLERKVCESTISFQPSRTAPIAMARIGRALPYPKWSEWFRFRLDGNRSAPWPKPR